MEVKTEVIISVGETVSVSCFPVEKDVDVFCPKTHAVNLRGLLHRIGLIPPNDNLILP